MTSQIRSRVEYLIPSEYILVLDWHFSSTKNLISLADLLLIIRYWLTFWATLYSQSALNLQNVSLIHYTAWWWFSPCAGKAHSL